MEDLDWDEKEEIARRWCSNMNDGIELHKSDVVFWNNDEEMFRFEFDIASHPRRKEIEDLNKKKAEYEKQHGKTENWRDKPFSMEESRLIGISPDQPDNRDVLGMVKSGKHDSGGNTYHAILGDCFLLSRAKADKKYMILTDRGMYEYFRGRCEPILGDIELVHLDCDRHRDLLKA